MKFLVYVVVAAAVIILGQLSLWAWDRPFPLRMIRGFAMGALGYLVCLILPDSFLRSAMFWLSGLVIFFDVVECVWTLARERGKGVG